MDNQGILEQALRNMERDAYFARKDGILKVFVGRGSMSAVNDAFWELKKFIEDSQDVCNAIIDAEKRTIFATLKRVQDGIKNIEIYVSKDN